MRLAGLPIFEFNPDKDKVTRAYTITGLFHNGRIYAPFKKDWAMDVIDEARAFPTGSHDDYMDTISQALLWMRNGGYISNSADTWLDSNEENIYNRQRKRYY